MKKKRVNEAATSRTAKAQPGSGAASGSVRTVLRMRACMKNGIIRTQESMSAWSACADAERALKEGAHEIRITIETL
jgi:hypothetical protein